MGLADHFKDEKALHSRVGRSRRSDYVVTFADAQELERIRKKLLKASLLLKLNAKVGESWNSKMRELSTMLGIVELGLAELMHQYAYTHEQHTLVVDSLCDRLSGTRKLVSGAGSIPVQAWTDCSSKIFQILSFRNTELAISTNIAIRGSGEQLTVLTGRIANENGSMRQITTEMHGDSKFIKALTLIAVLYTPASLVAVSTLCLPPR